jgi:hypothetical protein
MQEADHSHPFSAKVKIAWNYTALLRTSSWHGAELRMGKTFTYMYGMFCTSVAA